MENALAEHPAVAESAVVGSPDQKRGEVGRTQKPTCRDWRDRGWGDFQGLSMQKLGT